VEELFHIENLYEKIGALFELVLNMLKNGGDVFTRLFYDYFCLAEIYFYWRSHESLRFTNFIYRGLLLSAAGNRASRMADVRFDLVDRSASDIHSFSH
jgi:hypothetical protein